MMREGLSRDAGVTADQFYMEMALVEARRGGAAGEVPIGALVVQDCEVLATAHNAPIALLDPTAHAEILALRAASRRLGNYRLAASTVYVTVEPCLMCVGAMIHARVGLVVFGAPDPRAGALVSAARVHEIPGLNHRLEVLGGVLEEDARAMIQRFFRDRRS